MLNTILQGEPGEAPPLVIAHGLFGSARNWGVIAKRLSDARQVISVDMRNHGGSFHADSHTYEDMAGDLAEVIDAHGGRADVLGHSMGGKAAMMLALTRPDRVRRLVVADMAPTVSPGDQTGPLNAMRGVDLETVETRGDAGRQMDVDPGVAAFLLQSLDLRDRRWLVNLDTLGREMDAIMGWPDPEGRFDGPALFLRGARSDYVPDSARPAIEAAFPNARIETVADAGHWLHADQPRAVEAAVRAFLEAA